MRSKLWRVHDSSVLRDYEQALTSQDLSKVERLLIEHGKDLYWCICGAVCLKEKKHSLHKDDCKLEFEEPSILPHLELSIVKVHIESLNLIKERTLKTHPHPFNLSVRQWCSALFSVVQTRHCDVVKLFGLAWLTGFKYMTDTERVYADYVYQILKAMVNNIEDPYPIMNRTMIIELLPVLLPSYDNYPLWSRWMPRINQTQLGELLLFNDELGFIRREMVKKYGVLWNVSGDRFVNDKIFRIISSLINYVLSMYKNSLREEHRRWFHSLSNYQVYINRRVRVLVDKMMQDPSLYPNLHHTRMTLSRYVPVPSAKYTYAERASVKFMTWATCCYPKRTQSELEKEQREGLLELNQPFVF